MTQIIAMWSGPRNLSTALMYSFAARGDCAVWDEPFYAAYLAATGLPHPMASEVIAAGEPDPQKVAELCTQNPPSQSLSYQKHMTLHMIPSFDRGFLKHLTNAFLIRHPARVIASYAQKRESPTLADIGFTQQSDLFAQVADLTGQAPPVVDSADIRATPKDTLQRLCTRLNIQFTEAMLSWPPGPKPFDGAWAPHWYNAVHASSGFGDPEGPLPDLPAELQRLCGQALPHYESLRKFV